MEDITEAQRETILAKQIAAWPNVLRGAAMGNPFAGMCLHCSGKHAPPHDALCPYDPVPRPRP